MKKKVEIFLFLFLIFLFAGKGVRAYFSTGEDWENSVYNVDQFNLQSSTNETFKNLIMSGRQAVLGPNNPDYLGKAGKGMVASVGNLITKLYENPPASSTIYFADVAQRFGVIKPVYAQGVGFNSLNGVLPLWKASRNLAYILYIIVFLYIGLAIMFRVKISPQTVISMQNALPKLIISLILVTFSYAIVGLMIDLIYLLIAIAVVALKTPLENAGTTINEQQANLMNLSFFDAIKLLTATTFRAKIGLLAAVVGSVFGLIAIPGELLTKAIGGATLAELLIGIIILYCVLKLFISLVMTYVQIIISIIIGPLMILFGTIPGNQGGIGSWIKNLMANILIFPAVAIFLLLGWILSTTEGPVWTPPVIATTSGEYLTAIMGFGTILLSPKIPDLIRNVFKIKPSGLGTAISEPLQTAYRAGMGGYKVWDEKSEDRREKRAKKEAEYKDLVRTFRTSPGP